MVDLVEDDKISVEETDSNPQQNEGNLSSSQNLGRGWTRQKVRITRTFCIHLKLGTTGKNLRLKNLLW